MSKSLENEYKDLYEQELSSIDADALWNKIEAALPEKEVPTNNVKAEETLKFVPKQKWYRQPKYITLMGSMVAVVILGFLLSSTTVYKTALSKTESATNCATDEAPSYSNSEAVQMTESETAESFEEEYITDVSDEYQVIQMNFEITEADEDYYICILLEDNDLYKSGDVFYLLKNESVTVGNHYSMELKFIEEKDEKIFFEIF